MKHRIPIVLIALFACSAAADAPVKALVDSVVSFCKATKGDEARVGYNCPATATKFTECTKSGELTSAQALDNCVKQRLRTPEEQAFWASYAGNPAAKPVPKP